MFQVCLMRLCISMCIKPTTERKVEPVFIGRTEKTFSVCVNHLFTKITGVLKLVGV